MRTEHRLRDHYARNGQVCGYSTPPVGRRCTKCGCDIGKTVEDDVVYDPELEEARHRARLRTLIFEEAEAACPYPAQNESEVEAARRSAWVAGYRAAKGSVDSARADSAEAKVVELEAQIENKRLAALPGPYCRGLDD